MNVVMSFGATFTAWTFSFALIMLCVGAGYVLFSIGYVLWAVAHLPLYFLNSNYHKDR